MISVVIPLFNEEEGIPRLVTELSLYSKKNIHLSLEFIFVDDGSSDQTFEILKQNTNILECKIISFSKNFGSHAALRAGILHSSHEIVTFLYADLQDPIELIGELYEESKSGVDIVWANRKTNKSSFFEGLFSKYYASLMKKFAIDNFPEKGFDVVLFNQKVKSVLNKDIVANSSVFLQILSLGFKQSSIDYDKKERLTGKSKWTVSKKIKLFIDSFVSFSYAPLKLVTLMGVLLLSCGIGFSVFLILRKLLVDDLESGWATLISVLLIGFGITNISLGVIAEYLWRTFDAARKGDVFIIDEIIEKKLI